MKRSLIVIPAYNEEVTVGDIVKNCSKYCDVLVVNDGSNDQTARESKVAGALVITNAYNNGYDYCLNVGYSRAFELGYDIMITMDADGQLPETNIPEFINAIESGACVVVGCRNNIPRLCEKILAYFSSRLSVILDPYCGMKAYDLNVLRLEAFSTYYSIGTSLALKYVELNLKCHNIKVNVKKRVGQSKFGGKISSELKLFPSMLIGSYRIIKNWMKKR